jgi:DNA-nicking Smr family endonuclease
MHKPFAILEGLLKDAGISTATAPAVEEQREFPVTALPAHLPDEDLFGYAMKDVKALGWSAVPLHHRPPMEIQPQNDEADALVALEEFMRRGNVEIEQTPEYIEGAVQPRGRLYLDDLRSGRFSVQAYLDLHGMNQQEARFAVDDFILASVRNRLSCVRVIHGRGRHSHKQQPILKDSIQRWLCSRRLSRHVVAYTSARLCDGGGGAVYILLRSGRL